MSVHYKFKSALTYDTITFDGLHISVKDLKRAILQQKQIGKTIDFDLQITNAQTNEVYVDESALIPKNSSLIVVRIPLTAHQKRILERAEASNSLPGSLKPSYYDELEPTNAKFSTAVDLSSLDASEDDKIMAMMSQSTLEYDPSNYIRIRGSNQVGEVPLNYRCYKCHQPGHWIKDCSLNALQETSVEIRKSTGIPRSFMVPVDGPTVPGAMMTPTGQFAVPQLDHQAYKEGKKPVAQTDMEKPAIPEDLLCSLCNDLLTDAVMIPCCGNSFCDDCIRTVLLESENHQCPDCKECSVSPDTLIPNRFLRTNVNNFKSQTGYSRSQAAAPLQSSKDAPAPSPQASQPDPTYQAGAPTTAQAVSAPSAVPAEISRPQSSSPSTTSPVEVTTPPPATGGQPIQEIDSLHMRSSHYHHPKDDRPPHGHSSRSHDHHPSSSSSSRHQPPPPHSSSSSSSNHHFPIPTTNCVPPGVSLDEVVVSGEIALKQSMRPMMPHHQRLPMEERSGTPTVDEGSGIPGVGGGHVMPDTSLPPPLPVQTTYQIPSYPPPIYGQPYGAPPMSGPPMHHGGYPPRVMAPPYGSHPPPHGQVYSMDHSSRGGMRSYRGGYSRTPRSRGMHSGYRGIQNGSQLSGGIEDPVATFQRLMMEKEMRAARHRQRQRSYSRSRSRGRSRSRSRGGSYSRSPRQSRSPSRSRSVSPLQSPKPRSRTPMRSRSRSRSRSVSQHAHSRSVRSRSRSPVLQRKLTRSRSRSRTPSRVRSRSRSRSRSRHRSKSPSIIKKKRKSRSRSPKSDSYSLSISRSRSRSLSRSLSPRDRERHRDRDKDHDRKFSPHRPGGSLRHRSRPHSRSPGRYSRYPKDHESMLYHESEMRYHRGGGRGGGGRGRFQSLVRKPPPPRGQLPGGPINPSDPASSYYTADNYASVRYAGDARFDSRSFHQPPPAVILPRGEGMSGQGGRFGGRSRYDPQPFDANLPEIAAAPGYRGAAPVYPDEYAVIATVSDARAARDRELYPNAARDSRDWLLANREREGERDERYVYHTSSSKHRSPSRERERERDRERDREREKERDKDRHHRKTTRESGKENKPHHSEDSSSHRGSGYDYEPKEERGRVLSDHKDEPVEKEKKREKETEESPTKDKKRDKEKKKKKKDVDSDKKKKKKEKKEKKEAVVKAKSEEKAGKVSGGEVASKASPVVEKETEKPVEEQLNRHQDALYGDLADTRIDQSVVESYGRVGNDVNAVITEVQIQDVEVAPPATDQSLLQTLVEETQEGDVEVVQSEPAKDVMLAPVPELSKWELDDDHQSGEEKSGGESSTGKGDKNVVTSEVLKRAENVIFQKAVNAIRPFDNKRQSDKEKPEKSEKVKEKNESPPHVESAVAGMDSTREARKTGSSIQVTIPSSQTSDRTVEPNIANAIEPAPTRTKPEKISKQISSTVVTSTSPVRVSAKDRLGAKVDDSGRRTVVERVRLVERKSRSRSPKKMSERKVERIHKEREKSASRERIVIVGNVWGNKDSSRRVHEESSHKERERERERAAKLKERERRRERRSRSASPSKTTRRDRKHTTEKATVRKVVKEHGSRKVSSGVVVPVKKEGSDKKPLRRNARLASDKRKPPLDEANFEPDYDESSPESEPEVPGEEKNLLVKKSASPAKKRSRSPSADNVDKKKPKPDAESEQKPADATKESDKTVVKKQEAAETNDASDSSSDSSSESSVELKKKKKKKRSKKKKKKTKKRKKDSSSDSDSSDSSSSESEGEKNKKKKHKHKAKKSKSAKKKKKSKH